MEDTAKAITAVVMSPLEQGWRERSGWGGVGVGLHNQEAGTWEFPRMHSEPNERPAGRTNKWGGGKENDGQYSRRSILTLRLEGRHARQLPLKGMRRQQSPGGAESQWRVFSSVLGGLPRPLALKQSRDPIAPGQNCPLNSRCLQLSRRCRVELCLNLGSGPLAMKGAKEAVSPRKT